MADRSVELKLKATMDTKAAERNIDSLAAHIEAKARQIQALPKHQQRAAIERAAYDTLVRTRAATGVNAPADAQNMAMMRRAMQGAVQVIQVEQDALAQQQMDAHQKVADSANASNIKMQRFAYVATYSVVPALAALTAGSRGLSAEAAKAVQNINKMAMAAGSMHAAGTAVGGKIGQSLQGLGGFAMMASAVASAIAAGVETYTSWVDKAAERDTGQSTLEDKRRKLRETDKRLRGDYGFYPGQAEERADLVALKDKLTQEVAALEKKEGARALSNAALAAAVPFAMRTPSEEKQEQYREAQKAYNDLSAAAEARKAAFGVGEDAPEIKHYRSVQMRIQEHMKKLLEEIRDDGRTWRDYAMESLIKGERTTRGFSLRELQNPGPRQVNINMQGLGDEIAGAVFSRIQGPIIELANGL